MSGLARRFEKVKTRRDTVPKPSPTKEDFSKADATFASEVREAVSRAMAGHADDEDLSPEARRIAAALLAIRSHFASLLASDPTPGKIMAVDAGALEAVMFVNALLFKVNHPVWKFMRGFVKGKAAGNQAADERTEFGTMHVAGAIRAIMERGQVSQAEACWLFHRHLSNDWSVADLKRSAETIRIRIRKFDDELTSPLQETATQWHRELLVSGEDVRGIVESTEAVIKEIERLPRLKEAARKRPVAVPATAAEVIEAIGREVSD
jgi:hypothetical protein